MPGWRALLVSCLGVLALLPAHAVRADMAVAALERTQPATEPSEPELDCLALNIYWEARSESRLGQMAVAAVTLNRVAAPAFPDTVCEVVFQGEERGRHLCQFSWRCDGRSDEPRNRIAWEAARRLARLALSNGVADPTGGALWYHADHVLPPWAAKMPLHARIGHHLFYGRPPPDEPPGDIGVSFAQPDPMSELAAASQDILKSAGGRWRIDFEPDPMAALHFCSAGPLCGRAGGTGSGRSSAATSIDDQVALESERSAANVPPAPPRRQRSVPVS